jgi:hypothetical protein
VLIGRKLFPFHNHFLFFKASGFFSRFLLFKFGLFFCFFSRFLFFSLL